MGRGSVKGLKIFVSILFALVILGAWGYVIWRGEPWDRRYLGYGAIALCFLFSLLFIRKDLKKIFITLALATNVAADYFLVFSTNSGTDKYKMIGLWIFLGMQLFYFLYTLAVQKSNAARTINFALRVTAILVVIFILGKRFSLGLKEELAIIYIANSVVTLFVMLFHCKTEWLAAIGMLLFILCDVCVGLNEGGFEVINVSSGWFYEFITGHDVAFWFYTPGIFLISLSSVWAKKKQ